MGTKAEDNPTQLPFEQWKAGDGAAFTQLEHRFKPLLRDRIRRHRAWPLLAPHCELDDVLQEVWARGLPAAKTAFHNEGRGSLLAFLGTITDHVVIDLARRATAMKRGEWRAQSPASSFEVPDAARPGRSAPETPTGFARTNELTVLARATLNEREFAAWDLVEMQGFAPDEAALALRCKSSAAVRGLLLRARAKLAAQLTDERPNATPPARD